MTHDLLTQTRLTQTLASLDAAPARTLDDTARRRADARRDQILASDPFPSTRVTATTPALAQTRRRPWIAAAAGLTAVGAVVGAVLIAAPVVPSDPAYASWTATPSSVAAAERGLAGDACLESAGYPDADVVLAERRGEWIGVAAIDPDTEDGPARLSCLVHLPSGSTDPDTVVSGVAGGQGAVPQGGEFTEGSISEFSGWSTPGDGGSESASFTLGDVGPDVAAVDIIGEDGEVVHSTVSDGRFVAWWPGRVFEDVGAADTELMDLDYRITLRDGTVIDDAQPIFPE